MTGSTSKYHIPYPIEADDLRDGNEAIQALAERADYLLGEQGSFTFAAAVGTTEQVINLSRAYPNGFQAYAVQESTSAAGVVSLWTRTEQAAAGPGGVGRFTLGINMTTGAARIVKWHVRPNP